MRPVVFAVIALAACGSDSLPDTPDAAVDDDPLAVENTAAPGSLDDLHARIISQRCSGQPGLCHNGQFEPNLSTPALTYAYVVNRPAIEKFGRLRVKPGDPNASFFIDKIRNRDVTTQMPLGAEPLDEADVAALEDWIRDGALRSPGAATAPVLNNPPKRPQLGVYDTNGNRLDNGGQLNVNIGQTIVLRHTVQDFETADAMIPFSGVSLLLGNDKAVILDPANTDDPQTGATTYDATNPPMGNGDLMNRERSFTIPATLPRIDTVTMVQDTIPAGGANMFLQAFYIDEFDIGPPVVFGMIAFESAEFTIHIN
ncbi:MAG: hypothetical protein ACKV2T_29430 [Kofleriaceae bacterium]